jgi:hypothetical protein
MPKAIAHCSHACMLGGRVSRLHLEGCCQLLAARSASNSLLKPLQTLVGIKLGYKTKDMGSKGSSSMERVAASVQWADSDHSMTPLHLGDGPADTIG